MKKLKEKIKNKLGEKKLAKMKKSLRVARIVKNVVCWTLIAMLTIAVLIFVFTKVSGGSPTVFGYSLHRIVTGSMEPELEIGDVIINREVKDVSEVQIGDIVTFQGDITYDFKKVTHRVIVAPYDDGSGNYVIVTKGDANSVDDGEIKFDNVESKYLMKVGFLKVLYNIFFSQWGFLIFVFMLLLIFFDEIVNIIRLTLGSAKEEDTETFEEIVERVKREQLEEAKKKKAAEKAKEKKKEESDDLKSDDPKEAEAVKQQPEEAEAISESAEAEEESKSGKKS